MFVSRRPIGLLILIGVLAVVVLGLAQRRDNRAAAPAGSVEKAYRAHTSGIMVDAAGSVQRLLADDDEGSRHQRFVVALPSGHTILVAHNIDLAPRVPLAVGDPVRLRGQYEWNEQGGVIHWTHRDPAGRHEPGWIEHRARRYE